MQKSSREQIRNNHSLLKSEASKRRESTLLRHSQLDPWNSQIQITTRSLHWFSGTALGAFCFGIQCLVSALKHEFWWDGCIPSVPCIAHCSNPLQDIFALLQNGADLEKGWWSEPLRHAWPDKQDCARVWGQGRQSWDPKVIMRVLAHISAKYYKLLQMLPLG